MIISHRNRFVFVKTAKTAGTSLKLALDRLGGDEDVVPPTMDPSHDLRPRNYHGRANPLPELWIARRAGISWRALGVRRMLRDGVRFGGHTPAWVIRQREPAAWSGYLTFCVERDPWEKVVSGWAWARTQHGHPDLTMDEYLDFVEERIGLGFPGSGVCPFNLPNYTDPLTGEVIVDRILRYERLQEDLQAVMDELGLPVPELPRAYGNRRTSGPAGQTLTAAQVDRVGRLFAPEIELHGYRAPEVPRAL